MGKFAAQRRSVLSVAREYQNAILTRPQNIFYITGYWGAGVVILRDGNATLVTPGMEVDRAEECDPEAEVVGALSATSVWKEVGKRLGPGRSLIDSYVGVQDLRRAVVNPQAFLKARRVKTAAEVEKIEAACARVDRVYRALIDYVKAGLTEREVAAEALRAATLEGLTPFGSEGSLNAVIVASGANGAFPHAEVSDRVLSEGDLLVVDLFFRFQGYGADETRTYGIGRLSSEQRSAYEAVLEAEEAGINALLVGRRARKVHELVVAKLGPFSKYFKHGTGHGVGIDVHELPSLNRSSADVLRNGDVVTVEPGVYVPGAYGVRIEDMVSLGRKPVPLTHSTKDLVILG